MPGCGTIAGSNIHVALINPGPIDTEIWLKEDEPVAYNGPKYPPQIVTAAIFKAIEKRRQSPCHTLGTQPWENQ